MITILLILIPLFAGLLSFFLKEDRAVKALSLTSSIAVLAFSLLGLTIWKDSYYQQFSAPWMQTLGSSFSLKLDGMGQLLCLLNAIAYVYLSLSSWHNNYNKSSNFFGWLLLAQAGMMGVFMATDALLFYFFWELALIPMYFLCSQWGGVNRIAVSFKFFIYTFVGSVLMLIGILYVQSLTPDHSFSLSSFYGLKIPVGTQSWLFWLFFIAFAVKMPVFPFHTWQPDTYEKSPTSVTMILSGVMVKMGLLGVIRWLIPVLPLASYLWGDVAMSLGVIGIVYGSLLAIRQDDLKRLVAYSSIAHIGLMSMALFSENVLSIQGALLQMFDHGINIIGIWILLDIIERRFGTRKISELGGIAQKSPALTIFFVIIALANTALPLTNGFVGEFLMFNGIISTRSNYYLLFSVLAGLGIILSAVYTLNMIRKSFYGEANAVTSQAVTLKLTDKIVLTSVVILILVIGVYPQLVLDVTKDFSSEWFQKVDISYLFR